MLAPEAKFEAAKRATGAAIRELVDGTHFTIVAGSEKAKPVYPEKGGTARADAPRPGRPLLAPSTAYGPVAGPRWALGWRTCVKSWAQHPGALTHAILLTDGKDEHETLSASATKSGSAKANSPATAVEWGPTGRSRSYGRFRRLCWAPWTSWLILPISPMISRR